MLYFPCNYFNYCNYSPRSYAVYNCLVPYDDKSMETSIRVYICYNYYRVIRL